MLLVPSLLFGVSASLDALLLGVSYGLRGVHIRLLPNLFISTITLLGTCLSVSLGSFLTPMLPSVISGCAGSLILMFLGVYYITKWILSALQCRMSSQSRQPREAALTSAEQPCPRLTILQLFLLSLALSVNNLGIGLSASMAGLTLIPAAIATGVCSVLFLYFGNRLGRSRLLQLIGNLSEPISGVLLIGLSLFQLFL